MQVRRLLVLLAAMWVGWFDFGLQSTLGALFLSMLDQFGENRSTTASIQSMFIAVNQGLGVLAGLFITKFGITKVTLTGSILLPLGFFLSYFSTSVLHVNICIGFLSATGVSLMFVSSAVMLNLVFSQKELPKAMALHSSSISLAGLTYPFILDFVLETFSLRGTFLILSGYLLNNLAISIFFSYTITDRENETKSKLREKKQKRENPVNKNKPDQASPVGNPSVLDNIVTDKDNSISEVFSVMRQNNSGQGSPVLTKFTRQEFTDRIETDTIKSNNETSDTLTYKLESVPTSEKLKSRKRYSIYLKLRPYMTGLFSVPYVTILIATGLIIASQNGYVTLLIDIFQSKGYTKDQGLKSFLCLNLCGLIARLLPALLRHLHGIKLLILAILFSLCGCIGQLVNLFSTNYVGMMIGVGLTGVPMGGVISVASIVVAKLVGKKKFPVAFGLILTVIGILASSCGPAFGAIRDSSDSYSAVLIIIASVQFTGSAMFLFALLSGKKKLESIGKNCTPSLFC